MARKVFFSFHFQRDAWRVGQVRNADVVTRRFNRSVFLDKAEWEAVERKGQKAIKDWIDSNLWGTSVTVVLIGKETSKRPWVRYEIEKSWSDGKGLLGVYIHNVRIPITGADSKGANPFDDYLIDPYGRLKHRSDASHGEWFSASFGMSNYKLLSSRIKTLDWINNDGRTNMANWIEAAAIQVGR